MAFIRKRTDSKGKPRYSVVWTDPLGKRREKAAGTTIRSASALKTRIEIDLASGSSDTPEISFEELANKFLTDYVRRKLKPRTVMDYEHTFRKHLIPYFGTLPVGSISRYMVQQYIWKLQDQGLSPRSIQKINVSLGKAFVEAQKWDLVNHNPARLIDLPRQEQEEMEYLEPEEVKQLLEACSLDFLPLVAVAVLGGLRQGETLALCWKDVDFRKNLIHVRRTVSKGYVTAPKSSTSRRAVHMSPMLAAILQEHLAASGAEPDDLVFPGPDDSYMPDYILIRRFRNLLKAAKLRRIRWHDLRHTYATLMLGLGENLIFVQRQLGHSRPSTTLNKYGHLLTSASVGVGLKLDEMVFGEDPLASLSPRTEEAQKKLFDDI